MRTCRYHIDRRSELASLLEPGKTYSAQNLRNHDLGGQSTFEDSEGQHEGHLNLVCPGASGRVTFALVDSVPWPPQIKTRMRWHESKKNENLVETESGKLPEVSVLNLGSEPVTVQTRGTQRFASFQALWMQKKGISYSTLALALSMKYQQKLSQRYNCR